MRTGMYVAQVFLTSAYTFANTLAAGRTHTLMYSQFDHQCWGTGVERYS